MTDLRWHPRALTALALALAVGLLLTACTGSSSSSSTTTPAPTSAAASTPSASSGGGTTVTISNFAFQPDALTLPPGPATITVTNEDSTLHSFTLDDGSVSKDVPPGSTVEVKITVPSSGTLGWHCRIHTTMTGTITVG
jgi:plastocyanin